MKKPCSTPNIKAVLMLMFVMIVQNSFSQSKKLPDATLVNQTVSQAENAIAFIENKGQWPLHVLYRADVPGGQALATPDGMLLGRFNPESVVAQEAYHMRVEEVQKGDSKKSLSDLGPEPKLSGHGWKLKFTGGNPATPETIEKKNISFDYYNYLVGDASTHATNVHSFTEIIYKNVYRDIDVCYYTSANGELENDIIVKPHADAAKVALEIEGISKLSLNEKGELILPTTVGEVVIPHPVSYLKESGKEVDVEFVVTGSNTISFNIPDYDHSQTLVIDPIVMRWATFVSNNASSTGHCHGIDVDLSGNVYVTGQYNQSGLITVGAFQATSGGGTDCFVGKYTEPVVPGGSGARLWQTYLGASGQDNPYALMVGPDGFPYITGLTQSSLNKTYGTGFTAGGWTQRTIGTVNQQAFIAKLTPTGTGAMVREIGSTTTNFAPLFYDLKAVSTGGSTFDIIDVGQVTQGSAAANGDIPAVILPNGTANTGTGGLNGYAIRISSDFNTLVWSRQYSSSGNVGDVFTICDLDNVGNLYVGGYTVGTTGISFSNPSAQTTRTGTEDGWLLKLNAATGACLWSRYFNGSTGATDILCMQMNQAQTQMVIGGTTQGLAASNLIPGSYDLTYNGGTNDLFIASVPVSGASTTWGTYFGGSADEVNMMGLNLDQNDDVYVLGYTLSKNIITTGNPVQSNTYDAVNNDAIFIKLNANGQSLQYSTYLGGTFDEYDPVGERGIRFSNCRIYLAITSGSNNFPFTAGTLTPTRLSSTGNYPDVEPIIVSMANPPDLTANSITSGGLQTLTCGQTPVQITASAPSYSIPAIIRNNVTQTTGTSGAYPAGLPTISSYQWQRSTNGGGTWTNITGATGQNYTPPVSNGTILYRRIINGDACNRDTSSIATITINPIASPTPSNNGPICSGQTLQLSSTTIAGATYAWTGPNGFTSTQQSPSIPNATNAVAGTYTVVATVTATQCASLPASTTVTIRTGPTANAGLPRSICPNTSTTLGGNPTASGGTSPYTYLWSPGGSTSASPIVTPASTTTYTVQVNDASNCTATASVTVSTTLSLTLSATSTPTTCGLNNGSATVTPLTGTGPFTYVWNQQGNTPTIINLPSGNYSVITTDSIGCSASASVSVGSSVAVTVSATSTTTTCGLSNGSATVTPLTGVGPFTYVWNPSGNTPTISNLASGAYSVVATGAGGCSASAHTNVGASIAVTLSASSTTTTCGLNNGSATATPLTGVGPFTYVWNPSGNTATISNIASGPYSVVATGAGGCSASASTNVGASIAVTLSASSTTTTCGLNNGTATATLLTGVGPFNYVWNPSGNTATISNLTSGGYSVVATGDGGCSASAATNVGTSIAVSVNPGSRNTTCGLNNGIASVTITAGSGPFTYLWSTGSVNSAVGGLAPGTYQVTVTGAGGCSATSSSTVGGSIAITLSPSAVNTTCAKTNGSATVSVLTGIGPFAYRWNTGSLTQTISNLAAGTYKVTVSTGGTSGCSATATAVVGPSVALSVTATGADTRCGSNNGNASVSVVAGTGPYTYAWSNGRTTASIFSLAPGTYSVTVTGAFGCSATASKTIAGSTALSITAYANNASCGINSGSAGVNIITGTAPFTYTWNNGGTTQVISNIGTGIYRVTVTSLGGCVAKSDVIVTVADTVPPVALCKDITVALIGGNVTIVGEDVDNGSTDNCGIISRVVTPDAFDCSDLGPNSVTLTILDGGGNSSSCSATVTVIDTIPPTAKCLNITVDLITSPLVITAADVDDNSFDNCTIISREVTPASFDCSNLGENTVTLTVTDQSGHSSSCTATVTVIAPPFDVTATGGRLTCAETSVQLNATSQAPIINYNWSGPNGFTSSDQDPFVSEPGTYTVTVSNTDNGCSSTADASVTQDITEPGASADGGRLTCAVTTIQLSATSPTGGVTYAWSGPNSFSSSDQNPDVTEPGTYSVTVTNTDNGCTGSADANVTQDIEAPGATADGGQLTCVITSIQITAGSPTADVTYAWSGPNGFSSPDQNTGVTEPGTYTVTVTNTDNGCTSSADAIVTQDITEPGATARGGRLTCTVTSIELAANSPTGVVTYEWSGPNGFASTEQNPTVNEPGTYTVTVTNTDNGCNSSEQALVTQDITEPGVTVTGGRLTCAVTSIELTANSPTSGVTYEWSGPNGFASIDQNPTVGAPGTYTALVTNTDNGCTSSESVTVTQDITTPDASADGGRLTCAVTSIQLTASSLTNGVTYEWSGPNSFTSSQQNPSVSFPGTYTVTITNTDNGCTASADATVTQDITPPGASANGGRLTCAITSIQITSSSPTGGVSYAWSGPNSFASAQQNPSVSAPGIYSVTITNTDNGCTSSADANVTQDITPPGASANGGRLTCAVTSIQITSGSPTGGVTFNWSGPNGFASSQQNPTISNPGSYTVVITKTDNGCTSSANANVTQDIAAPGASASGGRLTCVVTSIQLTASSPTGGVTYSWSGPNGFTSTQQNPSVSTLGTYTVTVTNTDNGCTSSANAMVTQDITAPGAGATGGRLTCAVTSIQLMGSSQTGGVTYSWSGPNGFTSSQQNPSVTTLGTYTVTVTNTDNGCTSSAQAIVTQNIIVPNVTVTGGVVTCFVPCVQILATSATTGATFNWSGPNGFTSSIYNPTVCDSGRYTVTVTNPDNGCTGSGNVQIDQVVPDLGGGCGSAGVIASGFELEGNAIAVVPNRPDDWDLIYNGTSSPTFSTGVITDAPSTNDNYFTVGTKDLDDVSSWRHTLGSTPDKDDILHAGAAQYGTQLYFFGDRYAVSGTAQIGFWFFKNDVQPLPGGVFSANHTIGDLLILSNFTNGGSVSTILVYEWVGGGGSDGPLDLISVPSSSVYAIVNSAYVASPWPYVPKSGSPNIFPPGAFYEGGLDLACLPDINLCFASFLMETRTSASVTAALKDYVAGGFLTSGSSKTSHEPENEITDYSGLSLMAYPNPASDLTTFEFSLPEDGKATLEIYNSAGAKVASLFETGVEANRTYQVNYDTRQLANGLYIYKFSTNEKSYSRRLAVIH